MEMAEEIDLVDALNVAKKATWRENALRIQLLEAKELAEGISTRMEVVLTRVRVSAIIAREWVTWPESAQNLVRKDLIEAASIKEAGRNLIETMAEITQIIEAVATVFQRAKAGRTPARLVVGTMQALVNGKIQASLLKKKRLGGMMDRKPKQRKREVMTLGMRLKMKSKRKSQRKGGMWKIKRRVKKAGLSLTSPRDCMCQCNNATANGVLRFI